MISIEEAKEFLKNGCNIPSYKFDQAGDYVFDGSYRRSGGNGPSYGVKTYIPPIGWTAIGLKVLNMFGDNVWLGTSNAEGEWYVGYHGIKTKDSIKSICLNGFLAGPNQSCRNDDNSNFFNKNLYRTCGEGAYFAQHIDDANSYANNIAYNGRNYRVIFMCRLNPKKIRISNKGTDKDYMLANSYSYDEVRPYRILVKKV